MLVQYVTSASALSEEYLQKDLTVSLLRTFCFVDLLPKSGLSDEIVPTDWLPTDWLWLNAERLTADWRKADCRVTDCRKTDWLTAERLTDCRKTSGISRFLYKFQLSNEKRRFLLVRMLNFVISNWSKVTILNTLNALVSIYVTLLPLSQPVWPLHASRWAVSTGKRDQYGILLARFKVFKTVKFTMFIVPKSSLSPQFWRWQLAILPLQYRNKMYNSLSVPVHCHTLGTTSFPPKQNKYQHKKSCPVYSYNFDTC